MATTVLENPIRRIRQLEGKTLNQLAESIGINYQAVYLNECGTYSSVLPTIVRYFEKLGYDGNEIENDYQAFQCSKRQVSGEKYKMGEITDLGPPSAVNPLVQFRYLLNITRSKFCKDFCVHPASMRQLELNAMQTLPAQLHLALEQAGLAPGLIVELEERLVEVVWRPHRKVS